MKNIKIKCYKCKTENEITSKNISRIITCKHCHKKMILDKKSLRKLAFVRYGMLLVLTLVVTLLYSYLLTNGAGFLAMLPLIVFMGVVMLFADEIDKVALRILFSLTKNINYIEYVEKAKK